MFESRSVPLLSPAAFVGRMGKWLMLTLSLILLSLAMGVMGYHYFEKMPLVDALLNAAMILGGMGAIDTLHTNAGKLFASFYALYCGFFLVVCGGLLLVPIFHRMLHSFHLEDNSSP